MCKKNRFLICLSAYGLLLGRYYSLVDAEQLHLPKGFAVSEYFSFFGRGAIDWRALRDPNNNPILVTCIEGSAEDALEDLGITDLQQRLERLERGNVIKKNDGRYMLTFPAIIGDKRQWLREYSEHAARQLIPLTERMVAQIWSHLEGRDEMLYHVLWSVVMDGGPAWDAARAVMNEKIEAGDTSTENKAWLLYPSHPFRAGTNSYHNSYGYLRITWSRNTPSPNVISRIISQYVSKLTEAIEQKKNLHSTDAQNALGKYGLIDEAGKIHLYTIERGCETAKEYADLSSQFGRQVMSHLDVIQVADMLGVSPGIAFVIAYHEICWQLLEYLAGKEVLIVPEIVAKAGTKTSDAYQLVSLEYTPKVKSSFLEKEMDNRTSVASRLAITLTLILILCGVIVTIVYIIVKPTVR
jgi:hypothetical protein